MCHGSFDDVDVGALFRQKTAFKSLNQAEKLNIINNHFRPGENYAFPKVFMNGCNRSFQRSGSNVILGSFTARIVTVVSVSHAFYLPYEKA